MKTFIKMIMEMNKQETRNCYGGLRVSLDVWERLSESQKHYAWAGPHAEFVQKSEAERQEEYTQTMRHIQDLEICELIKSRQKS